MTIEKSARRIETLVKKGRRFLITAHVNLDGDAIGSMLALAHTLKKLGKTARIVCDGAVPDCYKFLPESGRISEPPKYMDEKFDAVFFLDVGQRKRVGKVKDFLKGGAVEINIDHHASNKGFGEIDIVDKSASAVGETLFDIFETLGWPLDSVSATQLYTAIYTDTGRFSFANTTAHSLEAAAKLVAHGVNVERIFTEVYQKMPRGLAELIGRVHSGIAYAAGGKIAYIHITRRDFKETGTSALDTQQFADIPRAVKGVEVAAYFREEDDGIYKVSFRSNGDFDLNRFAARFSGGGHKKAAGCTIMKKWPAVRDLVIGALEKEL